MEAGNCGQGPVGAVDIKVRIMYSVLFETMGRMTVGVEQGIVH